MAAEEKSNNFLILLSVGILIGAAVVYSTMKKQQLLSEAAAQAAAAQASAQQMQYLENLSSAVKRLEGKVQAVQTLQPMEPPILQPLKLLAPELMESLKLLEPLAVDSAPATYKNNESWEFKRGPDQTIQIGDKTITVPGRLQGINVIRNAKTSS